MLILLKRRIVGAGDRVSAARSAVWIAQELAVERAGNEMAWLLADAGHREQGRLGGAG